MNGLDLRPLSTGEILDRTFTLYRRHFLLFVGLAGIPQIPVLVFNFWRQDVSSNNTASIILTLAVYALYILVTFAAYVVSQGGAVLAVSKLYLGERTTIADSLRATLQKIGTLTGVLFLNFVAILAGFVLLVVPGIYIMCRLLVCVPAALIEGHNSSDSLARSFHLTRDYAGRAFLILLLYLVLAWGASAIVGIPLALQIVQAGPELAISQPLLIITNVASVIAGAVLTPILLISTSVFYYDLRVRKEAFDLQVMMGPAVPPPLPPQGPPPLPE